MGRPGLLSNRERDGLFFTLLFSCFLAHYDANRETVELTGETAPSGAKESIVYAMAGKTAQE